MLPTVEMLGACTQSTDTMFTGKAEFFSSTQMHSLRRRPMLIGHFDANDHSLLVYPDCHLRHSLTERALRPARHGTFLKQIISFFRQGPII